MAAVPDIVHTATRALRSDGSRGGTTDCKKGRLVPSDSDCVMCGSELLLDEQDPAMTTLEQPAVCTLDCPDTYSLTVTVDDGRITKVRGSDALPLTSGVICNKVAHHSADFVHGPGRLTTPLKRVGPRGTNRFERIAWEQALDIIYARVSEVIGLHGPEAVMPLNYAGPHGMLAGDSISLRFFH